MWRDNKVRSLYTAASASNIMGVPTLLHEEVVPSLPRSPRAFWGPPAGESATRAAAFPLFAPRDNSRGFPFRDLCARNFGNQITTAVKFFKDRIVLVGATAERLHDFYLTPWGKLSGPEINLHALAAMLRGSWLKQAGLAATIVAIVFAALASVALTFSSGRREIAGGRSDWRRGALARALRSRPLALLVFFAGGGPLVDVACLRLCRGGLRRFDRATGARADAGDARALCLQGCRP